MARLTLARKIAAITLTLWKRGEGFDAEQLKAARAFNRSQLISQVSCLGGGPSVLTTLGFAEEYP